MNIELSGAADTNVLAGTLLEDVKRGTLHSRETGAAYTIWLSLPANYANTTQPYGALILLDGSLYFPGVASQVRASAMERAIEDVIVVGISTAGNMGEHMLRRMKDYLPNGTPPDMLAAVMGDGFKNVCTSMGATQAQWDAAIADGFVGGIDAFLACLETELLPWLEASFRVDRTRLGIAGHSAGGAAIAHALLRGSSFTRYLGASFATSWYGDTLGDLETTFIASRDDRSLRFYESQGERESKPPVEEMRATVEAMMAQARLFLARLSTAVPARLDVAHHVIPGAAHIGSAQESYAAGIRHLFPPVA